MPSELPSDKAAEIARRVALRQPYSQIAREMRLSISTVSKYATAKVADPEPKAEGPRSFSESGDSARLEYPLRARVVTLDDAIAHGQVDTSVWYVDRWECTSWEMGFVRKDGEADSLPLWRVKLYLKRIAPKAILDAAEAIYERLATIGPRTFDEPVAGRIGRPALACFDLFDAHFGKLAWSPETGEDYDLRIAERRFRSALADLVDHTRPYKIERACLAIGNDFLHVDNTARQTTAGTPMDTDGRLAKIVEVAVASLVASVDYLLKHCDHVHLFYLPGNHDRVTSLFLCRELSAYFRHCERVTVDCSPVTRKYLHWGRNLIGFTHGDGLRSPQSLPIVMATEKPQEWAASVCREWHLGHLHTSRKFTTKDVDEHAGVAMRWMSALSGSDAWHHDSGYVGNRKAAECYLYDRINGYTGHFVSGGE